MKIMQMEPVCGGYHSPLGASARILVSCVRINIVSFSQTKKVDLSLMTCCLPMRVWPLLGTGLLGVNPVDQKEGTSWDGHTEGVAPGHHCLHDIVIGFVSHHQLPPSCPTAGMAAPGGGEG